MSSAFLLRMNPLGEDRVPLARSSGRISIGWGKVGREALDESLERAQVTDLVYDAYCSEDDDRRRAGAAAGVIWRFTHEMGEGDLVLVPHGDYLHVARVAGPATYDPARGSEHWAYQRPVAWLTGKRGTTRDQASDVLRGRLRTQSTCLDVSDLAADVQELI